MKKFTTAFLLLLLSCSTMLGQITSPKSSSPIRLDRIPATRMQIPAGSRMLGASTYELTVDRKGKISISFFSSDDQALATAEVMEHQGAGISWKYTDRDGDVWLNTTTTQISGEIRYVATTSAGGELRANVSVNASVRSSKPVVLAVTLEGATEPVTFNFEKSPKVDPTLDARRVLKNAEDSLFTTPGLRKLREVIEGYTSLRQDVLGKWSSVLELKKTCEKGTMASRADAGGEGEPPVDEPLGGPCSGVAVCARVTVLFPVFYCHSSNASCSGAFIIPDYVLYPGMAVNCSYLNCV